MESALTTKSFQNSAEDAKRGKEKDVPHKLKDGFLIINAKRTMRNLLVQWNLLEPLIYSPGQLKRIR